MPSKILLTLVLTVMTIAAATPIEVHGHRGARTMRPENTLPAFEYAIQVGVDYLEMDLNVTKDDVLVVSHDAEINRKICTGPEGETLIRKLTLEQVKRFDCGAVRNPDFPRQQTVAGTRIPTFDEVLALAPKGKFQFNVEMKSNPKKPEQTPEAKQYAEMVVAAIRKHGLEKRVLLQSFDWRNLQAVKAIAPEIRLSALYGGLPKDFKAISKEAGGTQVVSVHYLLVTKGKVKSAHKAGIQVVPWTPNEEGQWKRLIGYGVDAIITDDPAALIEYLKKNGLR
ncbi:MAG: glycerophosphodiester phosphodiesterase [Acidobacteria bacterium]|nr:glycerophosphodiester phosphodiesterase [Acidobacteriota bacterium]